MINTGLGGLDRIRADNFELVLQVGKRFLPFAGYTEGCQRLIDAPGPSELAYSFVSLGIRFGHLLFRPATNSEQSTGQRVSGRRI